MSEINFMFWNLNKKNLSENIFDLIIENNIQVFIFAEAIFDLKNLLIKLNEQKKDFKEIKLVGACKGVKIISDLNCSIMLYNDDSRYTCLSMSSMKGEFSFL